MNDDKTAVRQELQFDSDPGASRSFWIATILLLAIVGWMGSGFILPSENPQAQPTTEKVRAPVSVATRISRAEPVTLYFQAEGQAQPDRDTAIRSETAGDVSEILVRKGDDVEQGDVLARLSTRKVEADLTRATEELDRAQREFDNATALQDRGIATADRVAQARATLAAARAQVAAAQEALENTIIVAPFAGRIENLTLDQGEYVSTGSEVGRIVDNKPLTVTLQVPQQSLNRIRNGQSARVNFITGEEREGRVTFVGTSASPETRTFLVEVEVLNEDGTIPAGISAEIRIPTNTETAHFISPSAVSLDPEGRIGVKVVEEGRVVFHQIAVVRAEVDGIWVTGLPEQIEIITIGQGFVREGEAVNARPEGGASQAATASEGTKE